MSFRIVKNSTFKYFLNKNTYSIQRFYASGNKATKNTFEKRIDSVGNSISSKGFLRSFKPYNPPNNVLEKILNICTSLQLSNDNKYELINLEQKYEFLTACFNDFKHSVPNSQIYEVKTIGDVIEFYKTPVNTTTPLDAMKNIKLPENLHIQTDYLRFNPETDTKFNGQTAFPKSSTLVTGLKYRKKYSGVVAKQSWP